MKIIKTWKTFQTEMKYHDHYLSEQMQKEGIMTTFLSSDQVEDDYLPFLENKNIAAGEDDYKGSRIIRLKSFNFMKKEFVVEIKKMYNILSNSDFDVLHIYGIGNPISFFALLMVKIGNKDILVVANDHSNPDWASQSVVGRMYYGVNKILFRLLGNRIKMIITPGSATYNYIKNHYSIPDDRMQIIPLGYDADIFTYHENKKNKSNKLIIGFAGKIIEQKNIELLIDTLKELNDNDIECNIVGLNEQVSSYQKNLLLYAEKNGVTIDFKPLIKDPIKLAEFYNYIDIAVFPGSISITTIEANGCGTPIVLYESIDGLEDRVEGDRGFLFKTKDQLKEHIKKYKKLKQDRAIPNIKIAQQTEKVSWFKISKEYIDIYNRLLL